MLVSARQPLVTPPPIGEREVLRWACLSACVCVCSRSYLRNYTSDFHQFLCMLPMAVARYSSDVVMILYVFPVLWMTSYLHISTETSIPHILHRILLSSDSGKSTIVISLDLSAAFDTIDHQILLSRLNTSFGISDDTLFWLQSYLTNRTSSVRIGRHCSSSVTCTTGVPQGSVLGPLLFTAYVSPIAGIAHLHSIDK